MSVTKDLLAGLIFLAVGIFVVVEAQNYEIGTAFRMGPGYFPVVIGGLTGLVGAALIGKALLASDERLPRFAIRPLLLIVLGIVAFALALERLGLVVAISLLLLISRSATAQPLSWKSTAALCIALVAMAIVIFQFFLSLPLELWPWNS